MSDETYNGWANWETWAANLWLTNDEGTYNLVLETIDGAPNTYAAGDRIRDLVKEFNDEGVRLIGDDMSLWRVEWDEVAAGFMEE